MKFNTALCFLGSLSMAAAFKLRIESPRKDSVWQTGQPITLKFHLAEDSLDAPGIHTFNRADIRKFRVFLYKANTTPKHGTVKVPAVVKNFRTVTNNDYDKDVKWTLPSFSGEFQADDDYFIKMESELSPNVVTFSERFSIEQGPTPTSFNTPGLSPTGQITQDASARSLAPSFVASLSFIVLGIAFAL